MTELIRQTTSAAVRDRIHSLIVTGKLAAGTRLEELRLAKELGVSRTPLREALTSLEQDGLIERQPYKGCTVVDLDDKQLAQIYPVIGALEGLALRTIERYPSAIIGKLKNLNARMGAEGLAPVARYKLDRDWHAVLVSPCENTFLKAELDRMLSRSARFDAGEERGLAEIERSTRQHAAIAQALVENNVGEAANLIESHRQEGMQIVAGWRRSRR